MQNSALVAPVTAIFSYEVYTAPLEAERSESSIVVRLPGSYLGGFILQGNGTDEAYRLARIELRKPARVPPGRAQELPHILEASLVHQQVNGNRWANVVVGFEVSSNLSTDVLTPMVSGSSLPRETNQRGHLLSQSGAKLDLNSLFYDSNFLHFWAPLATSCAGTDVHARHLLRTRAATTSPLAYSLLLQALDLAPDAAPETAPPAWLLRACASGETCDPLQSSDVAAELPGLMALQSQALQELRDRKQLLDGALRGLLDRTGDFRIAVAARDDLRSAESQLLGVQDRLEAQKQLISEAAAATFDAGAPGAVAAPLAGAPNATAASAAPAPQLPALLEVDRCDDMGLSPADITSLVAERSPAPSEPLLFRRAAAAIEPDLAVRHLGNRLRLSAAELGAISMAGGPALSVSFADLRVPGEHAVDGQPGAMELQLLHAPGEGAWTGLSLRFEVVDEPNPALQPLIDALPGDGQRRDAPGLVLSQLHGGLSGAATTDYFHYEGTSTSPPCASTSWFVIQGMGRVGVEQLGALKHALHALDARPRQRFHAQHVAIGTRFTTVGLQGSPAAVPSFRGKKRLQI